MRSFLLLLFTLCLQSKVIAQINLVPNGDFEYYTECPTYQNLTYEINKALPWYNPTGNTPDYYNVCDSLIPPELGEGVPSNFYGYQYPRSGNGYAGIICRYSTVNGRDYISCPLILPLNREQIYYLEFYCVLANSSSASIGSLGISFSNDSISGDTTYHVLNLTPQIQHAPDSFLSDTLHWMKVSGTFTAQGGERFITIGNFNDDAHTPIDTFYYVPNEWYSAYYYIDDVALYEVKDTLSNHPFLQHENAFGNIGKPLEPLIIPSMLSANSDVNWQFIHLQENTTVKLYNAIGQLAFSTANYQNNLAVSSLAAGIYFYAVQTAAGEMYSGKVVVVR
ncbi:MAG: T9SS type A sorting domain-containing protein [Chitinophagales bacterium]|nr:T9SS type A sorting domain-containing protein [Chitinophagales bacterium]